MSQSACESRLELNSQAPQAPQAPQMDPFPTLRPRLLSLAYRLLGSWAEAEDVVQESHLAWLERGDGEVQSPQAFLERVVTNRCLDVLKSARAKRETYVGPWLPEPMLSTELHAPAARDLEGVSLAFLALLERLSPLERAVYVLAEAFDYSHEEIATALGREPAAVRQLLHRAREHVKAGRPRFAPDVQAHQAMLNSFFGAVLEGDVAKVERLLVADASIRTDGGGRVRAAINVVHGANRVARFCIGVSRKQPPGALIEFADVNGAPSLVVRENGRVTSVLQLETDGQQVFSVLLVSNPDKLAALDVRLAHA